MSTNDYSSTPTPAFHVHCYYTTANSPYSCPYLDFSLIQLWLYRHLIPSAHLFDFKHSSIPAFALSQGLIAPYPPPTQPLAAQWCMADIPPARIDASPHDDDRAMYGLRTRSIPRSRVPTSGAHPTPSARGHSGKHIYHGSVAHGVYTDAILPSTRPKPVTLLFPVLASTPNTTYNSARVAQRLALCYNTTTVLRRPLPPHTLFPSCTRCLVCCAATNQRLQPFTLTPSSSSCPIRAFGAVGATAQQNEMQTDPS
ncbi:hypothetical protein B0H14DRAFT_3439419 [Mycena olivaceomarginata]|nr:hypothetical protein B0H14DRAFT_3439419 [Mycena olivaceomarginata]